MKKERKKDGKKGKQGMRKTMILPKENSITNEGSADSQKRNRIKSYKRKTERKT